MITASRLGGLDTKSPQKDIQALSCVFRAGRAGALTDHSSILFDVDINTGDIKKGTTNAHWYVQGPPGWSVPWISSHDVVTHPDRDVKVTGNKMPDIEAAVRLCVDAHRKMMPDVPMVLLFNLSFNCLQIYFCLKFIKIEIQMSHNLLKCSDAIFSSAEVNFEVPQF